VLGDAGVWVAGERVTFPTARAELLVHMLALAGPTGLHQEVVADRLWPQADATRGGSSLRTALHHARRALGPEAHRIERDRRILRLGLTGGSLDLAEARRRVQEVEADAGGGSPPADGQQELLHRLDQSLLPAWADHGWVEEHEAERARALRWAMDAPS
jgi:two-component SAPR family response regulator